MKKLGYILYKGKSKIDGKLIIVIATGVFKGSENTKTGDVIQTWILRPDIMPTLAKRLGYDYSVCGNCKHRDFQSCYVNCGHEPSKVFEAYHNDKYIMFEDKHLEDFKDKVIRIGSYGDPAAVPTYIWDKICSVANKWSGYTHQWNSKFIDTAIKKYCMASVDSVQEYRKAKELGWRTFRIKSINDAQLENESQCFSEKYNTQCKNCLACMGTTCKMSSDIVINVHGLDIKQVKFINGMKKIRYKKQWRKLDFEYPKRKRCQKRVKVKK